MGLSMNESDLRVIEPLDYISCLGLMNSGRAVLTDSGGIREETTFVGVPCLTLRRNTEWPITITAGTNQLLHNPEDILRTPNALLPPFEPCLCARSV